MNSPWELVKSRHYTEAIAAYSDEIAANPSVPAYNNRATARLLSGDLDGALADFAIAGYFDQADLTRGDHSYLNIASVLWMQQRTRAARGLWRHTVDQMKKGRFTHSDLAGGVHCGAMLWFCAAILNDEDCQLEAERLLMKLGCKPRAQYWPGPLAPYLLGDLGEEAMFAAVSDTPVLRERQLCQAHFYAAACRFHQSDLLGWRDHITAASGLREAFLEVEYSLAIYESQNRARLRA